MSGKPVQRNKCDLFKKKKICRFEYSEFLNSMTNEELEQYNELLKKGLITEEEYQQQKQRYFDSRQSKQYQSSANDNFGNTQTGPMFWGMSEQSYCTLLHLSVLMGALFPFAGFILPLILWLSNKGQSERIDAHGKVVMNWIVSAIIYGVITGILVLLLIGIPLLIALGVCTIVFSVIGGIKASEGILWPYPLSLKLIS